MFYVRVYSVFIPSFINILFVNVPYVVNETSYGIVGCSEKLLLRTCLWPL
jgi:hypothetical protein